MLTKRPREEDSSPKSKKEKKSSLLFELMARSEKKNQRLIYEEKGVVTAVKKTLLSKKDNDPALFDKFQNKFGENKFFYFSTGSNANAFQHSKEKTVNAIFHQSSYQLSIGLAVLCGKLYRKILGKNQPRTYFGLSNSQLYRSSEEVSNLSEGWKKDHHGSLLVPLISYLLKEDDYYSGNLLQKKDRGQSWSDEHQN